MNAFVNDKSTTSSTTSLCPSLKGVFLSRINQMVKMEDIMIGLILRFLPFLEHVLSVHLDNNGELIGDKKISKSVNKKNDFMDGIFTKMKDMILRVRDGGKSGIKKKGRSKIPVEGEEIGDRVSEEEVQYGI